MIVFVPKKSMYSSTRFVSLVNQSLKPALSSLPLFCIQNSNPKMSGRGRHHGHGHGKDGKDGKFTKKRKTGGSGSDGDSDGGTPSPVPTSAPELVRSNAVMLPSADPVDLAQRISGMADQLTAALDRVATLEAELRVLKSAVLAPAPASAPTAAHARATTDIRPNSDLAGALLELLRSNTGEPLNSHGAIAKALKRAHPDGKFKSLTRQQVKNVLGTMPVAYNRDAGFTIRGPAPPVLASAPLAAPAPAPVPPPPISIPADVSAEAEAGASPTNIDEL